jgi:asparagine synthase (glutamine-hydrolysing)
MCGICGELRFDGQPVDIRRLSAAAETLQPRGPDDEGLAVQGSRGFGHRRLRIMDLAASSQQPMVDPALGLGLVFNGAIYNYPELRQTLRDRGYAFFSDGDTEVVLKAYHAWGARCVEHFQGMFAFAIWERDSGRTFLARDRLGIKPLYYAVDDDHLRFASTLPALLAAGDIDTTLDPVAVNHYLNFHAVVPPPRTIVAAVRKLAPGTTLTVEADGRREERRYWELSFERSADDATRPFEEWREALLEELRRAVRRRQLAAVDVGVLLSGGVDSSLLVGLMAEAGVGQLHTYSVGFESIGDEPGTNSSTRISSPRPSVRGTTRFACPRPNCCRNCRRRSRPWRNRWSATTVSAFTCCRGRSPKPAAPYRAARALTRCSAATTGTRPWRVRSDPFSAYRKAFFDRDYAEFQRTVQSQFDIGDAAGDFVREHFSRAGADDPVDKALRLDTTVMLVDDPVKRVDNMTMAWGLEARVPFLDHELVEFAARIPQQHKLGPGPDTGKLILKEAAREVIPAAVIDRPKGYFPVPALKYLQGDVLDYVRDALTSERARARALYDQGYVATLLDDPEAHITPLRGSKLWQLGLLELWLQSQGI